MWFSGGGLLFSRIPRFWVKPKSPPSSRHPFSAQAPSAPDVLGARPLQCARLVRCSDRGLPKRSLFLGGFSAAKHGSFSTTHPIQDVVGRFVLLFLVLFPPEGFTLGATGCFDGFWQKPKKFGPSKCSFCCVFGEIQANGLVFFLRLLSLVKVAFGGLVT